MPSRDTQSVRIRPNVPILVEDSHDWLSWLRVMLPGAAVAIEAAESTDATGGLAAHPNKEAAGRGSVDIPTTAPKVDSFGIKSPVTANS